MMDAKNIDGNIIEAVASGKVSSEDISAMTPKIDQWIQEHGKLRVCIDATECSGWANMLSFRQYVDFVKTRHHRVDKVGFIADHLWQRLLIKAASAVAHPEIATFSGKETQAAKDWVKN